MSENPTFIQALANATGRAVEVSPVAEATTIGAAFLAGLAIGVWERPRRRRRGLAAARGRRADDRLDRAAVGRGRRAGRRMDTRPVRPRLLELLRSAPARKAVAAVSVATGSARWTSMRTAEWHRDPRP